VARRACKGLAIYCTLRLALNHPANSETINITLSEYWDHRSIKPEPDRQPASLKDAPVPASGRAMSSS
jgi:hypothetical protein